MREKGKKWRKFYLISTNSESYYNDNKKKLYNELMMQLPLSDEIII